MAGFSATSSVAAVATRSTTFSCTDIVSRAPLAEPTPQNCAQPAPRLPLSRPWPPIASSAPAHHARSGSVGTMDSRGHATGVAPSGAKRDIDRAGSRSDGRRRPRSRRARSRKNDGPVAPQHGCSSDGVGGTSDPCRARQLLQSTAAGFSFDPGAAAIPSTDLLRRP
jgi:hypothetical protein